MQLAPAQQRILAPVGDPGLDRIDFLDSARQLAPIGVVRDDEGEFHVALAGALAAEGAGLTGLSLPFIELGADGWRAVFEALRPRR